MPTRIEPVNDRTAPADAHVPEVAALFLKLGFIAFGGPAAHIALMRQEVVQRRHWLNEQAFLDLLGASNLIPGPTSTELAIYLGYSRAGRIGLAAWVAAGVGGERSNCGSTSTVPPPGAAASREVEAKPLSQVLTADAIEAINARGDALRTRLNAVCRERRARLQFTGLGSLLSAHTAGADRTGLRRGTRKQDRAAPVADVAGHGV